MKKLSQLLCATIVIVAGASLGLAGTVEPGDSADLLMMPASPCETETDINGDPNNPTASADAACDEIAGSIGAEALVGPTLADESASAEAAVRYTFDVGSTEGNAGNSVIGNLSYAISWSGMQSVTGGAGQALVEIELAVYDISDPNNPAMIAEVEVHDEECTVADCEEAGDDIDDESGSLALVLQRGGSYLVEVEIEAAASVAGATTEASAISDYLDTAIVEMLSVSVGGDVAELIEQVEENTEKIASLEEKVGNLQTAVGDLEDRVMMLEGENDDQDQDIEDLEMALAELTEIVLTHTHTYLTGRGTGHNNTVADTGSPTMDVEPGKPGNGNNDDDDDDDSVDRDDKMKTVAPGRQRLGNRGNSKR